MWNRFDLGWLLSPVLALALDAVKSSFLEDALTHSLALALSFEFAGYAHLPWLW